MNISELWDLITGAIIARLHKALSLLRLHPNINRITQNVWVGGANHPYLITNEGFHAIVNLRTKTDLNYDSHLQKARIKYLKKPIPDRSGISPKDLLDTIEWIDARVKNGAKVLIHCNLGRGRAPLVASSYLVYLGLGPETALLLVKRKRRVTYLNSRQKYALEVFGKKMLRNKQNHALN